MPDDPEDAPIVGVAAKHSAQAGIGVTALTPFSEERVAILHNAICFVVAIWSGPARVRFSEFLRDLRTRDHAGIELMVIDHDEISIETQKKIFGELLHGCGEFFWVLNGSVNGAYIGINQSATLGIDRALLSLRTN